MNKLFKKIALVLAFAMVFTAMPMGVFAEDNSNQFPSGYFVDWDFPYGNGIENTNSSKEVRALIWYNGVQVTDFSEYEFVIGDTVYQGNSSTLAKLSTTPQKGVFTFSAGTGYTDATAYYPGVEIFVTVKHNGTVIDVTDPNNKVHPINVNIGPQGADDGGSQGPNLHWIPVNNDFVVNDTGTTIFYIDTSELTGPFANVSVKAFYDVGDPNGPVFQDLTNCYALVDDGTMYGIKLDGAKIKNKLPRNFGAFIIQAEIRDANGVAVAANTADVTFNRTPSIFQAADNNGNGFILSNGTAIMERQFLGDIGDEQFLIVAENGTNDAVHEKYLNPLHDAIFYGEDTTSVYFNTLRDILNNWDGDGDYLNSQYDGGALEVSLGDGEDNTGDDFKNHTLEELGKNTMAILRSGMYMKVGILDKVPSQESPSGWTDFNTFEYSEKYTHCEDLTFYAYIPAKAIEDCGGIENVKLYCYDGRTDYAVVSTTVASDVGNNVLKFMTDSPMEYYFVCWNQEESGEGEGVIFPQPELDLAQGSSTNEKLDEKLNKDIKKTIDELVQAECIDPNEVNIDELKAAYDANPDSVKVELLYDFANFDDMDESDFTEEQLTEIEKIVETAKGQVVYGMDIAVARQLVVNGRPFGDAQRMTELPSDVEFEINLPDIGVEVPHGKAIKWVIFRSHDGEISKLPVKDNGDGTGTFKTGKFSYYVLGFEFVDADATHNHLWGYNTQYDAAAHWDYCHVCGEKGAVVGHSDADGDGLCVCGWTVKTATANRANPNTGVTAEMLG